MSVTRYCRACGQGFDADNNAVGNPINRLCREAHFGPFDPVLTTGLTSPISSFLWLPDYFASHSPEQDEKPMTTNGLYSFVLPRTEFIQKVWSVICRQQNKYPQESASLYLSGWKAIGKTTNMHLIAQFLETKDYEVYFFHAASSIPVGFGGQIRKYAANHPEKKIAILVDEVDSNPQHEMFTALLKVLCPKLLVIGAAVPPQTHLPGVSVTFRHTIRTQEMAMRVGDTDFEAVVAHWSSSSRTTGNGVSPDMVRFICRFLVEHCNGHIFPVLKFMEFFCKHGDADAVASEESFRRYFLSEEFARGDVYADVDGRCFDHLSVASEVGRAFTRVISGHEEVGDANTLVRSGWWDFEKSSPISTLLLNIRLARIEAKSDLAVLKPIVVDKSADRQYNLHQVIIAGIRGMESLDFVTSTTERWPIENALSSNWATRVKQYVRNVFVSFQDPSEHGGWMEFYVNGSIDGGIEVLRNGSIAASNTSQNFDEHLNRFRTGKYKQELFALLNFDFNKQKRDLQLYKDEAGRFVTDNLMLPSDSEYHNHVWTYVHSGNFLFRGKELILSSAVHNLPGETPSDWTSKKRKRETKK